ncbi:related to conserved hypothetical Ustilaginaceae-specific protein [Melanopsichium pennsylvanicum]|uniref:RNI-like protein n=2 Tax=Melanopsichium pennsylvanicum TaxID=63383 RepID=A0A077QR28_9BASI|nr:conserved hypothetical protein [Melanopsichium pennsylvanicum 4]SNX82351.1 related to conserved hypothetical Ustilaginaceae-specific protein [Melanopsichium pennsylvanicum]
MDIDVDNASLPSDEDMPSLTPAQLNRRLPYGTLRVQAADEPVSGSKALEAIRSSSGRYHHFDLSHAYLGDLKIQKILLELREPAATNGNDDQQAREGNEWVALVGYLSRTLRTQPRPLYTSFRSLDLDDNGLKADCLPAICDFLTGNVTLHCLSLRANDIRASPQQMTQLAKALGQSGLRRLCLSSNPISSNSVASFFDSIPLQGTSLEVLEMSNLLVGDDSGLDDDTDGVDAARGAEKKAVLAAQAIASFLADAQRCRSLYTLLLNGNGLGTRGVRIIVSALSSISFPEPSPVPALAELAHLQRDPFYCAVLRARRRFSNTSLVKLELAGNITAGWLQEDPQKELERFKRLRNRYASIPADNVVAIAPFLELRTKAERTGVASADRDTLPIEMSRHFSTLGITLDEWQCDFQEAAEIGIGLNTLNRETFKTMHLSNNSDDGVHCREAAVAILRVARTIGCRAKRCPSPICQDTPDASPSTSGFHRFLSLPPELRLLILRKVPEYEILTGRQFRDVISFACDPSTIGYGGADYDWSRIVDSMTSSLHDAEMGRSSTLPAERWSWEECFTLRAPPRDWAADLLDASDEADERRPRGVKAGAVCKYTKLSPSMYAFIESTLTHRAES